MAYGVSDEEHLGRGSESELVPPSRRGSFRASADPGPPRVSDFFLSEDDWHAIQETFCLLSIPGMRESIRAGLAVPLEQCADGPRW